MNPDNSLLNRVITVGIIGMIGWILLSVTEMSTQIAVLQEKIEGVRVSVQAGTQDRYTATQAEGDFGLVNQRIERLETWAQNLSDRLKLIESDLRNGRPAER